MLKLRWSSGSFRGVINKRGGQKQIHPYLFYWINRNSYTNKSLRIVFPAHSLSMQSWLSWMLHLMENGYSFVFVGDFWNWSPKFLRQPLTNIVNTLGFKSLRLEAKLPSLTAFIYSWTDLLFSSEGGFQCQTHCSHCLAYSVLCKLWLKEGELMVVACIVPFESMFSHLNLIKDSTDFRSRWKYTYSCKRHRRPKPTAQRRQRDQNSKPFYPGRAHAWGSCQWEQIVKKAKFKLQQKVIHEEQTTGEKGKKIQMKDSKLMKNKSAATHTCLFLKMGIYHFSLHGRSVLKNICHHMNIQTKYLWSRKEHAKATGVVIALTEWTCEPTKPENNNNIQWHWKKEKDAYLWQCYRQPLFYLFTHKHKNGVFETLQPQSFSKAQIFSASEYLSCGHKRPKHWFFCVFYYLSKKKPTKTNTHMCSTIYLTLIISHKAFLWSLGGLP